VRGVIGFHYSKTTAKLDGGESQPAVIFRVSTTTPPQVQSSHHGTSKIHQPI
jgi:hypothetical protein